MGIPIEVASGNKMPCPRIKIGGAVFGPPTCLSVGDNVFPILMTKFFGSLQYKVLVTSPVPVIVHYPKSTRSHHMGNVAVHCLNSSVVKIGQLPVGPITDFLEKFKIV